MFNYSQPTKNSSNTHSMTHVTSVPKRKQYTNNKLLIVNNLFKLVWLYDIAN